MMEKIMNLVKDQVANKIGGMKDVPEDKKDAVVETAAQSIVDGLKKYATTANMSKLTSMFTGGGSAASGGGGMTSSLESGVVSALSKKVGLDPSVAGKIASTVIPAVMSLFKKKIADDNEPGFNIESLIGGLTGNSAVSAGGGIMNMVKGLFGKK